MSRFLIACGGTGGHLAPGIALAEGLAARGHAAHLLLSRKRIDATLVAKYPKLQYERIPAAPLAGGLPGLARFVWHQTAGLAYGWRCLRRLRPDAIVGFGGFTTSGIVLAGRLRRVPVALHEANHVPGRAVRLLGRLARRVYLPPGVTLPGLAAGVARAQGLPVRAEFRALDPAAAAAALGLAPAARRLVVLGGSQGAAALNDWAAQNLAALALEGVQVFCVTGPGRLEAREERVLPSSDGGSVTSYFEPFCDRMPELLACADLVVSRAGAGTLAELARTGTPAVLVPFPQAADNHQAANALHFAQQGGGLVVEQADLERLLPVVRATLADGALRGRMGDSLARLDRENSLDAMLDDLESLARPRAAAPGLACQLA